MSNQAIDNVDELLAEDMVDFYADPLGFVMYAYPWESNSEIQLVELAEPWAPRYGCRYGPDVWACELLDEIGEEVRSRGFDGIHAVDPLRFATASGHGIGKSAFVAWLVDWLMSTRPFAQGTVTANTAPQLETKTWAQIAKWTKLCITAHWFNVSTGRGAMKMQHRDHPESWFCSAQTCREENSEAFAGQHAASSTSFYIFDEASAVPDPIWEVAEGGLTDGEPMFFNFGNFTRNTGRFASCFGAMKHRWNTRQIDSRDVAITNKAQIQQWIDDYGEDSDFVRVRVRGVAPRAGSSQLIDSETVTAAASRSLRAEAWEPLVIGVDVARFGDDQSVIRVRHGRDARTFPAKKFRNLDTMALAAKVVETIKELKDVGLHVSAVFVDGGGVGGGVVDRLRQLGANVIEVNFGAKADHNRYRDKRAEIYGRLAEWLQGGAIPGDDTELHNELTGVEYGYNTKNQLILESKEDMKKNKPDIGSPDNADALAVTFAYPVDVVAGAKYPSAEAAMAQHEYDPFD